LKKDLKKHSKSTDKAAALEHQLVCSYCFCIVYSALKTHLTFPQEQTRSELEALRAKKEGFGFAAKALIKPTSKMQSGRRSGPSHSIKPERFRSGSSHSIRPGQFRAKSSSNRTSVSADSAEAPPSRYSDNETGDGAAEDESDNDDGDDHYNPMDADADAEDNGSGGRGGNSDSDDSDESDESGSDEYEDCEEGEGGEEKEEGKEDEEGKSESESEEGTEGVEGHDEDDPSYPKYKQLCKKIDKLHLEIMKVAAGIPSGKARRQSRGTAKRHRESGVHRQIVEEKLDPDLNHPNS
jgi:hypothetical protein